MDKQVQIIRQSLKRDSDRQKSYANLHRSSWTFQTGDKVFLRVKPKRSSLKLGKCKKLAFKYCGPFEVLQRMGEKSYKLALPPHLHVHNIFHVSLLKKYVPNPKHILDLDDNVLVNQEEFRMEPEQILKIREKQLRNQVLRDILVQWKGYPVEDASWEDWNKTVAQFLYFLR